MAASTTPWGRWLGDCRGVTAVEASLVFPLVLAMVYGLLETGRMMIARQEVSRLTDILARDAVIDSQRLKVITPQAAKDNYGLMLDPQKLDISVSEETALTSGERYRIRVDYQFDLLVSFDGILKMYDPETTVDTHVITHDSIVPKLGF